MTLFMFFNWSQKLHIDQTSHSTTSNTQRYSRTHPTHCSTINTTQMGKKETLKLLNWSLFESFNVPLFCAFFDSHFYHRSNQNSQATFPLKFSTFFDIEHLFLNSCVLMDSCSRPVEFMSIYLFQNGVACNPEKLRVKRNEIEKPFTKTGKCFYYQASVWVFKNFFFFCCANSALIVTLSISGCTLLRARKSLVLVFRKL